MPDLACICIDQGIHSALTADGTERDRLLAAFEAAHAGPGHLPEVPARDWYGKEAKFRAHLAKLRASRLPRPGQPV